MYKTPGKLGMTGEVSDLLVCGSIPCIVAHTKSACTHQDMTPSSCSIPMTKLWGTTTLGAYEYGLSE